jgi:hypothetical protein
MASCARAPAPVLQGNPANEYYADLVYRAPPPVVTPMNEINDRTELQMRAWSNCVFDKTASYMQANERAEVTVKAAMTSCSTQETELRNAISFINGSGVSTNELMEIRRKIVFEKLVQIVIDHRINLVTARSLTKLWTDCLVDRTADFTTESRSDNEIILSSYGACKGQENAMRQQLSSFNNDSFEIVEDRKKRVFPLLHQFVEALKHLGKQQAQKPDLAI